MKLNTTDFLRKCQHPLLLAIGSIPLALLVVMNFAPTQLHHIWPLIVLYVLLSWLCLVLPGKKRIFCGVIGAAALIATSFALLDISAHYPLLLLPLMYAALLFVTLPMGGWPRGRELNVAWHVVGILFYVLLQLLVNGSRMAGADLYAPAVLPMTLGFLGYAALLLLALNRASLESAAMSRRTVPLLMRRQNLVLTFALMALALLIAAIPAIGSLLGTIWDGLIKALALLGTLLSALMPQNQQSGGTAPAPADSGSITYTEAAAPSALAVFMEKMFGIIALITVIVAACFAARALLRHLKRLMKYLWARLNHYTTLASEDYVDEITDTRDEPDVERQSLLHRLRRMAPADEKGMSPTERVRYRYKRLKRKHDWCASATARETLPEASAALYERARYDSQTLTEAEAAKFREDTKRI